MVRGSDTDGSQVQLVQNVVMGVGIIVRLPNSLTNKYRSKDEGKSLLTTCGITTQDHQHVN